MRPCWQARVRLDRRTWRQGWARSRGPFLKHTQRIAAGSIAVGLVVLALKAASYGLTGSAALYSDAVETVTNVAASVVALVAMRYAARPADASHPYGHEKAEFFAAVLEAALIMVAAVLILQGAWAAWRTPRVVTAPWTGIGVNLLATFLNASWALLLVRHGRKVGSAALAADGKHLWADVVTSVGVSAGVAAAVLTGEPRLDPAIAALAALWVLWSGITLLGNSLGGLMDAAPDAPVVERIRALVATHANGALEVHDFRARSAGAVTFVDFHMVVPGEMTVAESHAICDRIEDALSGDMDRLRVTIHVEPEGKAKHRGVLVL